MSLLVTAKEPDNSAPSGDLMEDTIDEVHPDFLQPEISPPSTISSILKYLSICNIFLFCVYMDCFVRLRLFTFSLAIHIWIFPALSAIISLTTERKQYARSGQKRVFAKIISTYPAQGKPDQCFFVIQYIVDGITYQKKFLDKTFGLLSTEKFLEVVMNDDADPKEAVLAAEVDHYNTHGPRKFDHLLYVLNIMTLFPTLFLLSLGCTPTLSIFLLCPGMHDQCSLTTWIDALAHYLVVLGLYPVQQFVNNYIQTRKKDSGHSSCGS